MRPTILLIDDNPVTCSAMRRALEGRYAVEVATGGAAALARIHAGTYELILCDLMMPGLSGLQLIDLLAQEGSPALARLVITTGTSCTISELRRLTAHGVQLVHKPFSSTELLTLVEGYLARIAAPGDQA